MTKDETISSLEETDYLFKEYLNIYLDRYDDYVVLKAHVCMSKYHIDYMISSEALDIRCFDANKLYVSISEIVAIFIHKLHMVTSNYLAGANLQPDFSK